jgi:hypothetical protein
MKRTITFMLIAAMISVGALNAFTVNSSATQHQKVQQVAAAPTTITGKITKMTKSTLTIKDQAGKYHKVGFKDASMVQGLKTGDEVTVTYQSGKATSIQKVEGTAPSSGSMK